MLCEAIALNMFTNIMSNYTASSVNDISKFLHKAFIN